MPDKFKIFNRIRYSLIGVFAAVLIAAVIIFAAGFIGSPVVASAASGTVWSAISSIELSEDTDSNGIKTVDTNIYPQTTIAQLKDKLVVTGVYYTTDSDGKSVRNSTEMPADDYTIGVSFDGGSSYTTYSDSSTPFSDMTEDKATIYLEIKVESYNLTRTYEGTLTVLTESDFSDSYVLALRSGTVIYDDTQFDLLRTQLVIKESDDENAEIVYGADCYLAEELVTLSTNSTVTGYNFMQGTDATVTTITLNYAYSGGTKTFTYDVVGSAVNPSVVSTFTVAVNTDLATYYSSRWYQNDDNGDRTSYYAFTSNLSDSAILAYFTLTITTAGGKSTTYTTYGESSYTLQLLDETNYNNWSSISGTGSNITLKFTLTSSNDASLNLTTTSTIYFYKKTASDIAVSYNSASSDVLTISSTRSNLSDYSVTIIYNDGSSNTYTDASYGDDPSTGGYFTITTNFEPTTAAGLVDSSYTGSFTVISSENTSVKKSVSVTVYNTDITYMKVALSRASGTETDVLSAFNTSTTKVTVTYNTARESDLPYTGTLANYSSLFSEIEVIYCSSYTSYLAGEDTGYTVQTGDNASVVTYDTVAVIIVGKYTVKSGTYTTYCVYELSYNDFTINKQYKSAPALSTTSSQYYDESGVSIGFSQKTGESDTTTVEFDDEMTISSITLNDIETLGTYATVSGSGSMTTITFTSAGTYTITVTLTKDAQKYYRWTVSGSTTATYVDANNITFTYTVLPRNPEQPVTYLTDWTYGEGNSTSITTLFGGAQKNYYSDYGYTSVDFYITGYDNAGNEYSSVLYATGVTESEGVYSDSISLAGDFIDNVLPAGTYSIYVVLSGSTNYAEYTGISSSFTVAKQTINVDIDASSGNIQKAYSGTNYYTDLYSYITVYGDVYILDEDGNGGIEYNGSYNTDQCIWSYSTTETSIINVGTYDITITLNDTDNFCWADTVTSETFTFEVTSFQSAFSSESMERISYLGTATDGKAQLNVYTGTSTYTYSSNPYSIIYLSSSVWTGLQENYTDVDSLVNALSKLTADSDRGVYSASGLSTADVGTYYAVFYIAAEGTYANYTAAYGVAEFEIEKLTVGLSSNTNTEFTYSGGEQTYTVAIAGESGDTPDVSTFTPDEGSLLETYWVGGTDWEVTIVNDNNSSDSTISVSGATVTFLNAGTYTVTFTIKDTTNYELTNGNTSFTITITVKKATVALPTLTDDATTAGSASVGETLTYTYNGSEQKASISGSGDGATITSSLVEVYLGEDKQSALQVSVTTAGSYSVSVQLADAANYCWYDETVTDFTTRTSADTAKSFTIKVNTYTVTTPTLSSHDTDSETTYTVTYDGNSYYLTSLISGYSEDFTAVDGYDTYGELFGSESTGYVSTNSVKDAGTYEITVSLSDNKNMTWSDGSITDLTFTIVIEKKVVQFTWGTTEFTYDGTNHTVTATVNNYAVESDKDSITVTVEYDDNQNAGNHTATATAISGNNNYKILTSGEGASNYTQSFVIKKAVISLNQLSVATGSNITYSNDTSYTATYNGTTQTATVNGTVNDAAVTSEITLVNPSTGLTVSGLDVSFFNANTEGYQFTIQIVTKSNYCWNESEQSNFSSESADITITITVAQYTLSAPTLQDITGVSDDTYTVEYTGEAQNFVTAVNNLGTLSDLTYATDQTYLTLFTFTTTGGSDGTEGSYTQTNAGSYSITVSLSDSNFKWADGISTNPTYTFVITKKEVTIAWSDLSQTYTGSGLLPTATITGVNDEVLTAVITPYDGSGYSLSNGEAINAGIYTVSVTGLTGDTASNYTIPINSETFVICKVVVGTPSLSSSEFIYTGSGLPTTVEFSDGSVNTYDSNIIGITISGTTFESTTLDTAPTNNGATLTVTSAGNYTVTVTLLSTTNYCWSGEESDPQESGYAASSAKTLDLTVRKRAVALPSVSGYDETYEYTNGEQTFTVVGSGSDDVYGIDGYVTVTVSGVRYDGSATIDATNISISSLTATLKEAGTYTFTVTLTSTANFYWNVDGYETSNANGYSYSTTAAISGTATNSGDLTITINRKSVTAPALGDERAIEYVTGTTKYPLMSVVNTDSKASITLDTDWTIEYVLSHTNSGDDLGKYTITLTFTDSNAYLNYVWVSNTEDTVGSGHMAKYYLAKDGIDGTAGTITLAFIICAGSYTVTVTIATTSYTYGTEIDSYKAAGQPNNASSASITATYLKEDENGSIEYNDKKWTAVTDLKKDKPYLVGTYVLRLVYGEVYSNSEKVYESLTFYSNEFTISEKQVGVSWYDEDSTSAQTYRYVYDGTTHTLTAVVTDYAYSDELTFTFKIEIGNTSYGNSATSKAQNKGEYTVTLTGISGTYAANYKLPDELTKTFEITAREVTIVAGTGSHTYGDSSLGTLSTATYQTDSLEFIDTSVSGQSEPTLAGFAQVVYTDAGKSDTVGQYTAVGTTYVVIITEQDTWSNYDIKYVNNATYEVKAYTISGESGENSKAVWSYTEGGYTYTGADQSGTISLTFTLATGHTVTLNYTVTLNGSEVSFTNAGTYTFTASSISDGTDAATNYSLTANSIYTTFTIDKAILTVNVTDGGYSTTYGESFDLTSPTYTLDGLKTADEGKDYSDIITSGSITYTSNYTAGTSGAGSYTISIASQSFESTNYTFTNGSGATLTVNKRNITVTVNSVSSVYGEALATLSFTPEDAYDGTTTFTINVPTSDITLTAIYSGDTSVQIGTPVGTYVITGSVVSDSNTDKNYNVEFKGDWTNTENTNDENIGHAGTYTVTARPITISVADASSIYGNDLSAVTLEITNGSLATNVGGTDVADTASSVYGYIITNSSTKDSGTEIDLTYDAGTYYIYGDSNNGNYSIEWTYTTAGSYSTYTISARPVAVTVSGASTTYGNELDKTTLSWSYGTNSATFIDPSTTSVEAITANSSTVYDTKGNTYNVTLTTTAVASSDVASYITYLVIGSYSGATYTTNTTYTAGTYTIEMSNYTV
ncbi:MAG: hypothetical protein LUD19_02880, partial [Clostridia bacterium]|nr:hypothetical protein [Clostridia bacterium]